MSVKTLVLHVRDFEQMLSVRQRSLAFLHSLGIEPAFRENGCKLAVDYGDELTCMEGERIADLLMRHLGVRRK